MLLIVWHVDVPGTQTVTDVVGKFATEFIPLSTVIATVLDAFAAIGCFVGAELVTGALGDGLLLEVVVVDSPPPPPHPVNIILSARAFAIALLSTIHLQQIMIASAIPDE
jgi:hypothetical protein